MFERVLEVLEVSRILNGFHNDNPQLVNSHIDRNNLWERNMWKCFLSWQNMQNIIIALETLRSRTQSVDQSPTFWQFLQKSFHIFKRMSRWNFSVNAYLLCNISRVLILWRYSSNARLGTNNINGALLTLARSQMVWEWPFPVTSFLCHNIGPSNKVTLHKPDKSEKKY